jgi:hypothetical protein
MKQRQRINEILQLGSFTRRLYIKQGKPFKYFNRLVLPPVREGREAFGLFATYNREKKGTVPIFETVPKIFLKIHD